jgi:hypothetical protein
MTELSFDEFRKQMYIDNVDERLAYGEPVLQYKDYITEYADYLSDKYLEIKGYANTIEPSSEG